MSSSDEDDGGHGGDSNDGSDSDDGSDKDEGDDDSEEDSDSEDGTSGDMEDEGNGDEDNDNEGGTNRDQEDIENDPQFNNPMFLCMANSHQGPWRPPSLVKILSSVYTFWMNIFRHNLLLNGRSPLRPRSPPARVESITMLRIYT
ncbi:hypothetical protein BDN71DRAFT_222645 [Pleurotus eryngii]|uniref:Uncharacterized protein n=1 Tax=Pleurotus eryngii TaxID=5323 RepID=A0A9P5ZN74_PLEER|nr:hypothetical protein BDN71DRAFT_222645 [Pleurotus eryngii]